MLMHGAMALSVSLGVGYGVCVLASKQKAEMRTLGMTLGVAILAIAFGAALLESGSKCNMKDKWMAKCAMMQKCAGPTQNFTVKK